MYAVQMSETGQPEYLECTDLRKDMDKLRASASLPIVSQIVEVDRERVIGWRNGRAAFQSSSSGEWDIEKIS